MMLFEYQCTYLHTLRKAGMVQLNGKKTPRIHQEYGDHLMSVNYCIP